MDRYIIKDYIDSQPIKVVSDIDLTAKSIAQEFK